MRDWIWEADNAERAGTKVDGLQYARTLSIVCRHKPRVLVVSLLQRAQIHGISKYFRISKIQPHGPSQRTRLGWARHDEVTHGCAEIACGRIRNGGTNAPARAAGG